MYGQKVGMNSSYCVDFFLLFCVEGFPFLTLEVDCLMKSTMIKRLAIPRKFA